MQTEYLLAYDADCGPCSRFKSLVDFLDARGRIEFASLRQAELSGALQNVKASARHRSFHLVTSRREASSGADALLPLVGVLLPGGEAVSRALSAVPGCRRAVAFGYSALSRLHGAGACGTAAH